jgi:hypothetical protein
MNGKQAKIWKDVFLANLSAEIKKKKTLYANFIPTENRTVIKPAML